MHMHIHSYTWEFIEFYIFKISILIFLYFILWSFPLTLNGPQNYAFKMFLIYHNANSQIWDLEAENSASIGEFVMSFPFHSPKSLFFLISSLPTPHPWSKRMTVPASMCSDELQSPKTQQMVINWEIIPLASHLIIERHELICVAELRGRKCHLLSLMMK